MSACFLDQGLRLVEDRAEFAKRSVRDYLASSSDADHCTELFAYYEDLHPAEGTVPYGGGGLAAYHHVRFEVQQGEAPPSSLGVSTSALVRQDTKVIIVCCVLY